MVFGYCAGRCLNQARVTHPGGQKRMSGSSALLAWANGAHDDTLSNMYSRCMSF
jgi:hypothetical protein